MIKNVFVLALALALLLVTAATPVRAESEADKFGTAQTQKNSYEARREWRARNIKPIALGQSSYLAPIPDLRPRSSDEINAETARRLQAMHDRWDTGDTRTLQQKVDDRQRADLAEDDAWTMTEYPKLLARAQTTILQGDGKWKSFVSKFTQRERNRMRTGIGQNVRSPMADFGAEILRGNEKTPGDAKKAEMIFRRAGGTDDLWSLYALAEMEFAKGTLEGLAASATLFQDGASRTNSTMYGAINACRAMTVRAHAYGLGVPADPAKAVAQLEKLRGESPFLFNPNINVPLRGAPWADVLLLEAGMRAEGIGYPKDVEAARALLRSAILPEGPASGALLMGLRNYGGDLEDRAASWRILTTAYRAGHTRAGGDLVQKLVRGEGVAASPDDAYALAMTLEGLPPGVTAELARGLMSSDRKKAAAVLARHALPEDAELQALLAETKAAP